MRDWPAIVGCLVAVLAATAPSAIASDGHLLIGRDHQVHSVRLVRINDRSLVYGDAAGGLKTVAIEQCVALLDSDAAPAAPGGGLLRLADGQRFPGEALSGGRPADDVLVWIHPLMGRMEVPLDRIESVMFAESAALPAMKSARAADVLLLANGDELEGFVTALGDPITIEVSNGAPAGDRQTIEIPLSRAAAVRMITPPRKPTGWRLWLISGTVVDVARIVLSEDGFVQLVGLPFLTEQQPKQVPLSALAAVLFDPEALSPFGALAPTRVQGPPTRYVVPPPRALDDFAPLGLSRVEFRGPVTVRYDLVSGPMYFLAEARLSRMARSWGDCELVIRDDEQEVFRARLNAEHSIASIGIALHGSQLTIEITEGSNGPIQDHVVLHRAMLLSAQP